MKKIDWTILILILFTYIVGIYLYPKLPEQIPIHWNIEGEVDFYGGKLFGTFLIPTLNLFFFAMFVLLPKLDPRKENYQKFTGSYKIIRHTVHLFFILLFFVTMYNSLNVKEEMPKYLEISFIVPFTVSILLIILGNYLGKIKDNFFVGIKTPWTLSSKNVWYKTHRLASKLYVLSGILGLIGSFFNGTISAILLIVPILTSTVVIVFYSYFEYQKEIKNQA